MNVVGARVGLITLVDGTSPTEQELPIPYTQGDTSFGPLLGPGRMHEVTDVVVNGEHVGETLGDPIYAEGSFSAKLDGFMGAKFSAFILGVGTTYGPSGSTPALSVDGATNPVRKLGLKLAWSGTDVGGADEEFTFERSKIDIESVADAMDGINVSIKWKTYGRVLHGAVVVASQANQ